ncbi:hypothetical protein [Bifidobacterium biavatii]|uniref:Phage protein n=1 Tax=Bifidobacterium biavatii DSM 23969 TaxID=1437608 RepID=A0A086ZU16_9BIFI|nr:hypothetical protein [Bifidobacterium biavatii]KFI50016.1 phage protein [Bifidobacterium biavatii DSM 23969]
MKGETVTVTTRPRETVDDDGNVSIIEDPPEQVDDVLVADATNENLTDSTRPDGIHIAKTLCFPRAWPYRSLRGATVTINDHDYAVIGDPAPYTGGITPTRWNLTVQVADTEG